MTQHRMRLVEQLIEEDSGDFLVEAPTPEFAAGIPLRAHQAARARDSNLVTLEDGQCRHINPTHATRNETFCLLMDENGEEIEEVHPEWENPPADEQQQAADGEHVTAQTGAMEPGA